jgi:hypothetical protein
MNEGNESTVLADFLSLIDKANEERYNYLIKIESALNRFSPPMAEVQPSNEKKGIALNDNLASKISGLMDTLAGQNNLLGILANRLEKIM